ncbi:MAG: hypothetical protein U5K81_10470 [Trueperaceae bacterium]|nr:hypothetical protein [Trueperaceae bacterium]
MRRRILVILLPLALALAACTPPQSFPKGTTDVDVWRNSIRDDTEVPNQYPNGTTRSQEDAGAEDDGH